MASPDEIHKTPLLPHIDGGYLIGPLNQKQFDTVKTILPDWVSSDGEKAFSVKDNSGAAIYNALLLVQDELGRVHTLIPGIHDGNMFTARRFLNEFMNGQRSDYIEADSGFNTGKTFSLAVEPNGNINADNVEQLISGSERRMWPGTLQAILDYKQDSEQRMVHEKQEPSLMEAKRIDKRLYELLEQEDGVFIGEMHSNSNVRQMLTYMMPSLKVKGVETISIEFYQEVLDELADSPSVKEAVRRMPGIDMNVIESFYPLVQAAKANGIKVLGHEQTDSNTLSIIYTGERHQDFHHQLDYEEMVERHTKDHKALARRDAYAANYIEQHKAEGKIVVLGGAAHSTNRQVPAPNGYRGLNERLGIPSMDVELTYDKMMQSCLRREPYFPRPDNEMGLSCPNTASGSDFIAMLPPDIESFMRSYIKKDEYAGTSWPPTNIVPNEMGTLSPPSGPELKRARLSPVDYEPGR